MSVNHRLLMTQLHVTCGHTIVEILYIRYNYQRDPITSLSQWNR